MVAYFSIICLDSKKCDRMNIKNYQTITLLSYIYKLLIKVILNKIGNKLEIPYINQKNRGVLEKDTA